MIIGSTPLTQELYRAHTIGHYDKHYAVNICNRFKAQAQHLIVTNQHKGWAMPSALSCQLDHSVS